MSFFTQPKNLFIIIIILIVIIIFIYGFSLLRIKPVEQNLLPANTNISVTIPETTVSSPDQEQLQQERLNDVELFNSALAAQNPQLCQSITNLVTRDSCYNQISQLLSEPSICQNIYNQNDMLMCLYSVNLNIGASNKNLSQCEQIGQADLISKCKEQLQANNFCLTEDCL